MNNNFAGLAELRKKIEGIQNAFSLSNQILDAFKQESLINTNVLDTIREMSEPKKEIIDRVIDAGWTIPISLFSRFTNESEVIKMSDKQIDDEFVQMYLDNDGELYKESKNFILEEIAPKFKGIITTCFEQYEFGDVNITIPALLTVIEGELSINAELKNGYSFKKKVKKYYGFEDKDMEEVEEMGDVSIYSLVYYLENKLFANIDFNGSTNDNLNRNKVLHGWCDPDDWDEVDFIRLTHTLVTIELLK